MIERFTYCWKCAFQDALLGNHEMARWILDLINQWSIKNPRRLTAPAVIGWLYKPQTALQKHEVKEIRPSTVESGGKSNGADKPCHPPPDA